MRQGELTALPDYADLQPRLRAVLDARDRIPQVTRRGDFFYNFWQDAAQPRGLWRRTTLAEYRLTEPALQQLATIVRGADTSRLDLAPQSAGLYALSLGLSQLFSDDHTMLRHGLVMYDALHAWCRSCQEETHAWPPKIA